MADIRCPTYLIVESEGDGGRRWIVPEDAVAFVCNYKWHTDTLTRGCVVIMSTTEHMVAMVEVAFLILAQAVIMLIRWRSEAGADLEEGCVSGAAVVEDIGIAVLMIGNRHLPALHANEVCVIDCSDGEANAWSGAVEELRDVGAGADGNPLRPLG